jgi:hypothetical protein
LHAAVEEVARIRRLAAIGKLAVAAVEQACRRRCCTACQLPRARTGEAIKPPRSCLLSVAPETCGGSHGGREVERGVPEEIHRGQRATLAGYLHETVPGIVGRIRQPCAEFLGHGVVSDPSDEFGRHARTASLKSITESVHSVMTSLSKRGQIPAPTLATGQPKSPLCNMSRRCFEGKGRGPEIRFRQACPAPVVYRKPCR